MEHRRLGEARRQRGWGFENSRAGGRGAAGLRGTAQRGMEGQGGPSTGGLSYPRVEGLGGSGCGGPRDLLIPLFLPLFTPLFPPRAPLTAPTPSIP